MKFIHKDRTARSGITLIEFIVSFGIFLMLITLAGASFVRSMRVQRTALQLVSVNDNIGITLEQMMREMRTGYHFCTKTKGIEFTGGTPADILAQCNSLASDENSSEIQFVNASNETVRYRWANQKLQKGVFRTEYFDPVVGATLCPEGSDAQLDTANGFCYRTITADNIKVTNVYFDPRYNGDDDAYPPRITMSFSLTTNDPIAESLVKPVTIQTTVSARCGESACPANR